MFQGATVTAYISILMRREIRDRLARDMRLADTRDDDLRRGHQ